MTMVAALLSIAFDRHQSGRYDEAEALYRRILGAEPGQPLALHRCGLLVAQLGRLEEADRLLARAVAVAPLAADPAVNHGKVLRALRRPADAGRRFRHAAALQPALVAALEGLGHAERERGDAGAAATGYGRAAQVGGAAAVFRQWGIALDEAGRPAAAVEPLRHAIRLDPTAATLPARLAAVLLALGHQDEAAACCRRALTLRPDHADSWRNLAVIAKFAGDGRQADRRFDRSRRLDPTSAGAPRPE